MPDENCEDAAYKMSSKLAAEKGSSLFKAEEYLKGGHARKLKSIRQDIASSGLRNGTHLDCTHRHHFLAGNVSSGIEPIFSVSYERKVRITTTAA
jgi:ribonucleoside-diphosphate reductase alpha chain